MKITSIILMFIFGLVTVIFFPIGFIYLNNYYSFPILTNIFLKPLGLIFILLGGGIDLHCIYLFFQKGKGTPVPIDPPKKLVIKDIYKYSRNPMYIVLMLIILGEFLFFGHLLLLFYLLLIFLSVNLMVIFYEEPTLKKKFGKNYLEYYKKTPRWL